MNQSHQDARLDDGTPGPIEVPWHWGTDDAPYALFAIQSPRRIAADHPGLALWNRQDPGGWFHGAAALI